jgi:cold shock protein
MRGKVARLMIDKGFGFVRGDDGVERFFHRSAVWGGGGFESLSEGQAVEFEEESHPRGPRARSVKILD